MSDTAQSAMKSRLPVPFAGQPWTILAPMQDITTPAFMKIVAECGAPDGFVTEFFRVHETSTLEKHILDAITKNDTGRPIFAQLIGENIPGMARAAHQLLRFPIAGIDLNLGCPAPKVFRKNVGGGLLRDLKHTDNLLAALRNATDGLLTVKMRTGFNDTAAFDDFLALMKKHRVDLLTVHGRTVHGLYRSAVDYDAIARAVASVPCPVIANGDVTSVEKAVFVLKKTQCAGVMIGRSAIRNPWIFRQIREHFSGSGAIFQPTLGDVRAYIEKLAGAIPTPEMTPFQHASRLKKFLNFIATGVDAEGKFLTEMRHAQTLDALLKVCDAHLILNGKSSVPFANEPFAGIIARPNCEQNDTAQNDT